MLTHQHHVLLLPWAVCVECGCAETTRREAFQPACFHLVLAGTALPGSVTQASGHSSCCQTEAHPLQVVGLVTASDRTVSRRVDLAVHELAGAIADDRATAAVSAHSSLRCSPVQCLEGGVPALFMSCQELRAQRGSLQQELQLPWVLAW